MSWCTTTCYDSCTFPCGIEQVDPIVGVDKELALFVYLPQLVLSDLIALILREKSIDFTMVPSFVSWKSILLKWPQPWLPCKCFGTTGQNCKITSHSQFHLKSWNLVIKFASSFAYYPFCFVPWVHPPFGVPLHLCTRFKMKSYSRLPVLLFFGAY